MKGLAVSTLAESMFQDAWNYHTKCQSTTTVSEGATATVPNVAIFYDSDILKIYQVFVHLLQYIILSQYSIYSFEYHWEGRLCVCVCVWGGGGGGWVHAVF